MNLLVSKEVEMSKSITIIGAGLAGLSAGCYAQMNGYKTRIFQMHDKPGGLCTTWKRKGYAFDGSIHYMLGSRSGPYHRFYEELGAVQDRRMVDHEELMRVEGSGGQVWTVYTDIDRLEQHMKDLSPADAELIKELCRTARLFLRFEIPVDKPMEWMGLLDMLKLLKNMPATWAVGKYGGVSMQDYATRFKDPFLREVFPLMVEDLPGMPMANVLVMLASLHNKNNGWPIGGSLAFAEAIEKRYRGLGGKVQYRARVEKVLVEADQAVAFHAQGDTTQAMSRLERALAIAEPGGFIRTFADEGPPMGRVLYEALSREIAPDYVRRLLAAFPSVEPEQREPSKSQAPETELIEPLSERELEVLQLIAEGLTNREIASRLFLSLNTVKTHTRNVYGKLDVHNRTQAVGRARALGVLPTP
jgi:DNA-binding CsgD family transcriptional regulator